MQKFMIAAYRMLLPVITVLMLLVCLLAAAGQVFSSSMSVGSELNVAQAALVFGLIALGSVLAVVMFAGGLYLTLGIYDNTRKMAELLEKQIK